AEQVAVFLEGVAQRDVTVIRRVDVCRQYVATRPVAIRHRARFEGHANAVTGVKARAAHFREIPARTEVTRAHFRVRFKAAAGEHDAFTADVDGLAVDAHARAMYAAVVVENLHRACIEMDRDAAIARKLVERFDQARTA